MRTSAHRPTPAVAPESGALDHSATRKAPREYTLGNGETVALAEISDRLGRRMVAAVAVGVVGIGIGAFVSQPLARLFYERRGDVILDWLIAWAIALTVFVALTVAAAVVYETVSTSSTGTSWGPFGTDVRVVRRQDGRPPGLVASLVRTLFPVALGIAGMIVMFFIASPNEFLAPYVSPLPWSLAYVSACLDKHRRGWHDKLAGTVAISP